MVTTPGRQRPRQPRPWMAGSILDDGGSVPPLARWDGIVRPVHVDEPPLNPAAHSALVERFITQQGSALGEQLTATLHHMRQSDTAMLNVTRLISHTTDAWSGCTLWIAAEIGRGACGVIRIGYLGGVGLVAVKEMTTRAPLARRQPESTRAGATQAAVDANQLATPFAALADQPLVSDEDDDADTWPTTSSGQTSVLSSHYAPSGATLQSWPSRILHEARCQQTYSSHKLTPIALLHDATAGTYYLVMPLMHGSLNDAKVHQLPPVCRRLLARWTLYSICEDLNRLRPEQLTAEERRVHPEGIAHDDLKLRNFLYNDTTIALGDWDLGIARHNAAGASDATASTGTPGYMAPERFPYGKPSCAADIWSLGVSVMNLFSTIQPFIEASRAKPHVGNTVHLAYATFYTRLAPCSSQALARLDELKEEFPDFVAWIQPVQRSDPHLCSYVMRHLLHPDPQARITPPEVLAAKARLLPDAAEQPMQALQDMLRTRRLRPWDAAHSTHFFFMHFLPFYADGAASKAICKTPA